MSFFEKRPWGWMIKPLHTKRRWLKLIRVTGRTSLQSHRERIEYHINIRGIQRIEREEVHRMGPGWYVEYAYGSPRENDIVRYEDDYGRI